MVSVRFFDEDSLVNSNFMKILFFCSIWVHPSFFDCDTVSIMLS